MTESTDARLKRLIERVEMIDEEMADLAGARREVLPV